MFSWPPAMTISASPHLIACAARWVALRPLPHTLPIVMPGTPAGRPARISAWRAGFCPTPAVSTWPRITSDISSGATPVRASSALIKCAPRSAAGIFAIDPPNFPTAVLSAAVMTTSLMSRSSASKGLRLTLFLQDVFARRVRDRQVAGRGGAELRRVDAHGARMLREPVFPDRPPGAGFRRCRFEPGLRRQHLDVIQPRAHSVASPRMHWPADDARIVTAGGQQKGEIRGAREPARLVNRLPGCDMVRLGADDEHRELNLREFDGTPFRPKLAARQFVVEVQLAQVLSVHAARHACAVGIPGHQIIRGFSFAAHVRVDRRCPQQIARAQQRERRSHLIARKNAGALHDRLEHVELAWADEHRELAGLTEILLRGEQRHAREPLIAVACVGGGRDRQQGPADAIAHGMNLLSRHDLRNGIDHVAYAESQVIVHAELAVARVWILPGHDEHGMALRDQVPH